MCIYSLGMVKPKDSKFFFQPSKVHVGPRTHFKEQKVKKYVFVFLNHRAYSSIIGSGQCLFHGIGGL